jgi:hypothetical protein
MIGVGGVLGDVPAAVLVLPGIAIGYVGSYALGDLIADDLMSARFTSIEPARDDAAARPGPSGPGP